MSNLRPFQIALLGGFLFLAVAGFILLGMYESARNEEEAKYGSSVVIWGTLDEGVFREIFRQINDDDEAFRVVSYTQIDERSFDTQFVNALAEGSGPDMIVLPADKLVMHRSKLMAMSYENFPVREFQTTFVDGAEIFARPNGLYAVPFAVDPLMVYWNEDLFASNGLAQAPSTWEDIVGQVVPRLTIRDTNRNVLQSGIAFGEFRNVAYAKEVLLTLALQSGSRMVQETDNRYEVQLNTPINDGARAPFSSTLQFYTDFSNANSPLYSWNRAQPLDENAFIAGDLAMYFAPASVYDDIARKNPNLNFNIASVPQGAQATAKRTYGEFYGFAIPAASANKQGAARVAFLLSSLPYNEVLTYELSMASPRRDLIALGDPEPQRQAMLESTLIARSWLDPHPQESTDTFMQMVEDVVSNRTRILEAVNDAISRLQLAF